MRPAAVLQGGGAAPASTSRATKPTAIMWLMLRVGATGTDAFVLKLTERDRFEHREGRGSTGVGCAVPALSVSSPELLSAGLLR